MPCRRQRGFTLVELMVVIVILGGLIALVGPNIWSALFESNRRIAEAQMANFASAIDQYKMTNKRLPDSLMQLTEATDRNPEPLLASIPPDPWGQEYDYRLLDKGKFRIQSYGDDQQPDTEDDIFWPRESN